MKVEQWDEQSDGSLTEDAIRRRYQPAGAYRVSRSKYPPGTRFVGAARAGTAFVISGACRFAGEGWSVELREGQYVELPAGDFDFETGEGVTLVRVWLLPPEFRR
jgi:hypothetical protein